MSGIEEIKKVGYTCFECGGIIFKHTVYDVYEETFNTVTMEITEGEHHYNGERWYCSKCGFVISSWEDIKRFFSILFTTDYAPK